MTWIQRICLIDPWAAGGQEELGGGGMWICMLMGNMYLARNGDMYAVKSYKHFLSNMYTHHN